MVFRSIGISTYLSRQHTSLIQLSLNALAKTKGNGFWGDVNRRFHYKIKTCTLNAIGRLYKGGNYHQRTEMWKGNVFSRVCVQSFCLSSGSPHDTLELTVQVPPGHRT